MEYPWIPAAIVVYCEVGVMVMFAVLLVWYKKAEAPRSVHAVFFPVHVLTGRFYKFVPLVDYVWDHWRFSQRRVSRYVAMGAYCVISILCWPLRLPWLFLWCALALALSLFLVVLWFLLIYLIGLVAECERLWRS